MKSNKRKKQNRISIILIIVALVLIIGCVVYLLCGKMGQGLADTSSDEITEIENPMTSLEDKEAEELDATKLNELEDALNAQFLVGIMYERGHGIKQDSAEAFKWFLKAAEQGNSHAQNIVAVQYHLGQVVKQDDWQAVQWLKKSAEQGDAEGQYILGLMYGRG